MTDGKPMLYGGGGFLLGKKEERNNNSVSIVISLNEVIAKRVISNELFS